MCIQTERDGDPVAVDLALPSGAAVGELLPAIVDLVDDRAGPGCDARRWRLDRPSGANLQWSLSLLDNGVRDGDLLILRFDDVPRLDPSRAEPSWEAIVARRPTFDVGTVLPGTVCALAALLASTALAWTAGSAQATASMIVAGIGAVAAVAVAMTTGYAVASNVAVVSMACATGFLAVPSGPAAPNVFLAAAAAFSASLLMSRLSCRASSVLTATAAVSLVTALATVVALPAGATGTTLAVGSLALLALAPRISLLTTNVEWVRGQDEGADRALLSHTVLSGLVAGSAAGAASGTVMLAVIGHAGTAVIAFDALVGVSLLLRARTYADPVRQTALLTAGVVSIAACLYVVVVSRPEHLPFVAGALIVTGLSAVRRPPSGAAVARALDRLEYVTLAAIVPVGCWTAGVYALVGGFPSP